MFSMLPLLKKDGLLYWYWILNFLWYSVTSWVQPLRTMQYVDNKNNETDKQSPPPPQHPILERWRLSYKHISDEQDNTNIANHREPAPFHYAPLYWCYQPIAIVIIYFMTDTVQWTDKYPDIGTYFIMIYSFAHFGFAWILFVLQFLLEYFEIFECDHILLCNEAKLTQKQKQS